MQLNRRGFTLIELLVVVAIIALLIGILLPALGQARITAKGIVAGSMARQLATGVAYYGNDFDQFIPGLTTSTTALSIKARKQGMTMEDLMNSDSAAPVQNWDWITPALGGSQNFSTSRIPRFLEVLDFFNSPAMDMQFPAYPFNAFSEWQDLIDGKGGVQGPSWLQPGGLIWWGRRSWEAEIYRYAARYGQGNFYFREAHYSCWGSGGQVEIRPDYKPTFDNMYTPARKGLFADGFRYWSAIGQGPDVELTAIASWYGAFSTSSPIYSTSTAYSEQSPGSQLSYRYNGRINVGFGDGHVEMLSVLQSQNPELWYPSGSTFWGATDTAQGAFQYYERGDKLN